MPESRSPSVSEDGRPLAGPTTIGVVGEVRLLRDLLQIERDRLQVALRIERERSIVFPETTVIVKDIERLLEKVRAMEEGEGVHPAEPRARQDDLAALLRAVDG